MPEGDLNHSYQSDQYSARHFAKELKKINFLQTFLFLSFFYESMTAEVFASLMRSFSTYLKCCTRALLGRI